MGCGNGLLVYVLNDQGYSGYGIDMRKRKIWSSKFYLDSNVKLLEQTIDPRSCCFEDVDWLIGNHSDELSPWLPVIALKSSKKDKCNFFLIPCCFFDFTCKYEVKKKGESRYDTYLNFLKEVCHACGFHVFRDKLRIPSTKNVCFICSLNPGSDHTQEANFDSSLRKKVLEIVADSNSLDEFSVDFKARDLQMEKDKSTRNCTKNVKFELRNFIIKRVLEHLLNDSKESRSIRKEDGSEWNAGATLTLGFIANLFEKETLNKLKLECGGISMIALYFLILIFQYF
jgi:tRNASer (uridine44-2'-O)-methyltransferase